MIPAEDFRRLEAKIDGIFSLKQEEAKYKDYVSKEDACTHFGWGEATWYRLRKDNLIKVYRIGKKQYVKQSELDATLKSGSI